MAHFSACKNALGIALDLIDPESRLLVSLKELHDFRRRPEGIDVRAGMNESLDGSLRRRWIESAVLSARLARAGRAISLAGGFNRLLL